MDSPGLKSFDRQEELGTVFTDGVENLNADTVQIQRFHFSPNRLSKKIQLYFTALCGGFNGAKNGPNSSSSVTDQLVWGTDSIFTKPFNRVSPLPICCGELRNVKDQKHRFPGLLQSWKSERWLKNEETSYD